MQLEMSPSLFSDDNYLLPKFVELRGKKILVAGRGEEEENLQ